ncbi:ATP-grasp domain-containing protein [Cupriavidus sp. YAF13]|uniref:ATP-grasp domain-containing protein n=1 Tax=Cupriavidus sp. YAF13 TaxID=3233075 RepID=UPI003F8F7FC4
MPSQTLIVAALSSRMMAESAAQAGLRVAALDLFGDADTRHVAQRWEPIGATGSMALDGEHVLAALRRLRDTVHPFGWVAGSGFEQRPDLLDAGHALVPLLGNSAATVRGVKQPGAFFRLLAALGIPHPETTMEMPREPAGWLCKAVGGTGGSHIRQLASADANAADAADGTRYFQRQGPGLPMSALFVAHRRGVHLVGISLQRIGSHHDCPYLFHGAAGPAMLPASTTARLVEIIQCIARETSLVGLNSIDFLFDAPDIMVLEVNPRPPASMALYTNAYPLGLMHAHLQACRGETPEPPAARQTGVRGFQHVFAQDPAQINAALTVALMRTGWCHDIPVPGSYVAAGHPFCSVSAAGLTEAATEIELRRRSAQIQSLLKARHDERHRTSGVPAALNGGPHSLHQHA